MSTSEAHPLLWTLPFPVTYKVILCSSTLRIKAAASNADMKACQPTRMECTSRICTWDLPLAWSAYNQGLRLGHTRTCCFSAPAPPSSLSSSSARSCSKG
eukprot:449653-Pelagomonas_calceolata.AAC.4